MNFTISEIDIQIGEQLYLHIENVKYEPATADTYYVPGTGAEINFKDEDCKLMYKESSSSTPEYFDCPPDLINCYFDFICEWVDEYMEEKKYKAMEAQAAYDYR